MQNRHLGGDGFAGGAADDADKSSVAQIIRFPRRCQPPLTLSEIVARYSAARFVRRGAITPLPEDLLLPEFKE